MSRMRRLPQGPHYPASQPLTGWSPSIVRRHHHGTEPHEVRHRWCELIVKHKYRSAYRHVEQFLQEDQAMGVYLYGELMVSEDARQQQLARRCFELVKEQMDRSSVEVVAEMLF